MRNIGINIKNKKRSEIVHTYESADFILSPPVAFTSYQIKLSYNHKS